MRAKSFQFIRGTCSGWCADQSPYCVVLSGNKTVCKDPNVRKFCPVSCMVPRWVFPCFHQSVDLYRTHTNKELNHHMRRYSTFTAGECLTGTNTLEANVWLLYFDIMENEAHAFCQSSGRFYNEVRTFRLRSWMLWLCSHINQLYYIRVLSLNTLTYSWMREAVVSWRRWDCPGTQPWPCYKWIRLDCVVVDLHKYCDTRCLCIASKNGPSDSIFIHEPLDEILQISRIFQEWPRNIFLKQPLLRLLLCHSNDATLGNLQ